MNVMTSASRMDLSPGVRLGNDNEWTVVGPATYAPGRHSRGYFVKSDHGLSGFLKVLDYDSYLIDRDPAARLKAALDAYHDERRLLEIAREHNLGRIVRLLCDGSMRGPDGRAECSWFIFELANSDATVQRDEQRRLPFPHALQLLHDVAVGLSQLHSKEIAHQDVASRNVFLFPERRAKLGDLGRAVDAKTVADHVVHDIAGDVSLAPPELLYGYRPGDWRAYRLGCDVYLLGSLVTETVVGLPMTPQLMSYLPEAMRYSSWSRNYDAVLPALVSAQSDVLIEVREQAQEYFGRPDWANEVASMVRHLCHPDPEQRGCPVERTRTKGDPYGLGRFVTKLDLMQKRAVVIDSRRR